MPALNAGVPAKPVLMPRMLEGHSPLGEGGACNGSQGFLSLCKEDTERTISPLKPSAGL